MIHIIIMIRAENDPSVLTMMDKAPIRATRAFSRLKASPSHLLIVKTNGSFSALIMIISIKSV